MPSIKTIVRRAWGALGPGLTTGAADDDPSGIATYSQAGAQFGYALTWSMLLTLPFMAAIQLISALIGWHTRRGLAANIATTPPSWVLLLLVALLVVANTVNIAADLAAMGAVTTLLIGGQALLYAVIFGLVCLTAEILIPYHLYADYGHARRGGACDDRHRSHCHAVLDRRAQRHRLSADHGGNDACCIRQESPPAAHAAALAAISRLVGHGSHGRRRRRVCLDLDLIAALRNARERQPLHR